MRNITVSVQRNEVVAGNTSTSGGFAQSTPKARIGRCLLMGTLVGAAAWSAFGPREGLQMAIAQQSSITTAAQSHRADIIDDIIDLIDGIMGGSGSGATGGAGSGGSKP